MVYAKSPYAIVYATYKSLGTQNKTHYIYSLPIFNFSYLSNAKYKSHLFYMSDITYKQSYIVKFPLRKCLQCV